MPALASLPDDTRRSVSDAVSRRWKPFVHIGVVLFLVSGLYNYMQAIGSHKGDGLYHALLGIKMLAALFIFFIAAALVGRSPKLEPMRQQRGKWLTILVVLAMLIVGISGFVRSPRNSRDIADKHSGLDGHPRFRCNALKLCPPGPMNVAGR